MDDQVNLFNNIQVLPTQPDELDIMIQKPPPLRINKSYWNTEEKVGPDSNMAGHIYSNPYPGNMPEFDLSFTSRCQSVDSIESEKNTPEAKFVLVFDN